MPKKTTKTVAKKPTKAIMPEGATTIYGGPNGKPFGFTVEEMLSEKDCKKYNVTIHSQKDNEYGVTMYSYQYVAKAKA